MKSNFYEKIISSENENKKLIANKIMNLLEESIENYMDRKNIQLEEKKKNIEKKEKVKIEEPKEELEDENYQRNIENRVNNDNYVERLNRRQLHDRILNYERENDELMRLIDRYMIETVG